MNSPVLILRLRFPWLNYKVLQNKEVGRKWKIADSFDPLSSQSNPAAIVQPVKGSFRERTIKKIQQPSVAQYDFIYA